MINIPDNPNNKPNNDYDDDGIAILGMLLPFLIIWLLSYII
jgi:hypothetical protein